MITLFYLKNFFTKEISLFFLGKIKNHWRNKLSVRPFESPSRIRNLLELLVEQSCAARARTHGELQTTTTSWRGLCSCNASACVCALPLDASNYVSTRFSVESALDRSFTTEMQQDVVLTEQWQQSHHHHLGSSPGWCKVFFFASKKKHHVFIGKYFLRNDPPST